MNQESGNKYNIICLSNQLWDYPLWTNKKQVMTRLSKSGHTVLFVDPPINMGRLFFRQFFQKKWPLKRLISGQYTDAAVRIFSAVNFLPIYSLLAYFHARRINKIASKCFDKDKKTLLWIYHVEIEGLDVYLKRLNYDYLIYDCVDNYAGFPKYDTAAKKERVNKTEQRLAAKADIVFASAPGLVEKLRKFNQNIHYMPNVGDYEKFKNVKQIVDLPGDVKDLHRPIVGYTGAIDEYKFDRDLFRKVASNYPGYTFVLVGPMALKDREGTLKEIGLADLTNVVFLGTRDYSVIQN